MRFRICCSKGTALRAVLGLGIVIFLFLQLPSSWTNRSIRHVLKFDPTANLTNNEAKNILCRQHGWSTFKGSGIVEPGRRVYDLIMVNTELDWLEIRLNTTYNYVDYFVVVESPKTFTNLDKPLIIKESLDKFSAYRDKIIYHELEIPPGFHSDRANPAWAWEDLQRNAMYEQVLARLTDARAPVHGDVIIVADVDEIIRPETLVLLKACDFPPRLNLRSHFYYYSFQNLHIGEQWTHPQATYFQGSRTILPVNLRNSDGGFQPLIKLQTGTVLSAGWHCSSCFATIEEFLTKLASFSHIYMNQEVYRDRERIAKYVRQGKDLWDREGEVFTRIENNQDVPKILLDQQDRFKYLLNRDGASAGFTDYP